MGAREACEQGKKKGGGKYISPAQKAELPQLKVYGIGLVTAGSLAVGEEEMRVCIIRQTNRSSLGRPGDDLVLLLK
jgi:hypothetical protein